MPSPHSARIAETELWFVAHGLVYFVPEQRSAARAGLRRGRLALVLALVAVGSAAIGGLLAWASDSVTAAPATLISLALLSAVAYSVIALKARPILTWALKRTFGSLRTLLPLMSRALPMLLLFVTFLFINAELWEMAAALREATLWLVAVLFTVLALGFLLVRLPEEVDRADDAVDADFVRRACVGTPLESVCEEVLADPTSDPLAQAEVQGFERWNLVGVLLVIQAAQVLLLASGVFVFFLVFGGLTMNLDIQANWTGIERVDILHVPFLANISTPLVQVSIFLSAFAGLYLSVATVTDEAYRIQFFSAVQRELERAVGVRAVYLALREREAISP